MTKSIDCATNKWYPNFKQHTIRTVTINIPNHHLLAILMTHPDSNKEVTELTLKISQTISMLGGSVFPKSNWSSAKDAAWSTFDRTCRCQSTTEVLELLRASTLCDFSVICMSSFLQSMTGFRCFVRDRNLIAISQRKIDIPTNFEEDHIEYVMNSVKEFYLKHISKFELSSFSFDIYFPSMESGSPVLIDFGTDSDSNYSCLFSPEELKSLSDGNDPVIRLVSTDRPTIAISFDHPMPMDADDSTSAIDFFKEMNHVRFL
ncbi:hypothetical protein ACOME3_006437 [Neoechinorhynchus agilis]